MTAVTIILAGHRPAECVVLDCPDASGVARFYQALLGGTVIQADPRWTVNEDFSTLHTESGPS
jgi:hypothetical protein